MNQPGTTPLAIVIPAYKTKFLREALQSIADQTDKNFQLYVGDDCSPEPVAEIVREFAGRLPLRYHRFENNLGGRSLVQQFERCCRLTTEPWVWIFSDDDVMDAGCVAAFLAELKNTSASHDLYRFNTVWVNSTSGKSLVSPLHPQNESGADFLLARLRGGRNSTLQELIFSRAAWEAVGGMPDFPLGWAADDALVAKLGRQRPIRTIAGARVNWRLSDVNLTNEQTTGSVRIKIRVSLCFLRWVSDFFKSHHPARLAEAKLSIEHKLLHELANCWIFLDQPTCREVDALGVDVLGHRRGWGWWKGLQLNARLALIKILLRLKIPCEKFFA